MSFSCSVDQMVARSYTGGFQTCMLFYQGPFFESLNHTSLRGDRVKRPYLYFGSVPMIKAPQLSMISSIMPPPIQWASDE